MENAFVLRGLQCTSYFVQIEFNIYIERNTFIKLNITNTRDVKSNSNIVTIINIIRLQLCTYIQTSWFILLIQLTVILTYRVLTRVTQPDMRSFYRGLEKLPVKHNR